MKRTGPVLLICENHWSRTRETALRLETEGIRSIALVKITPNPELRELIRRMPPHPLIRQHFIHRKFFRVALFLGLPLLLAALRSPIVRCDKEKTFRVLSPRLQRLGIRCSRMED